MTSSPTHHHGCWLANYLEERAVLQLSSVSNVRNLIIVLLKECIGQTPHKSKQRRYSTSSLAEREREREGREREVTMMMMSKHLILSMYGLLHDLTYSLYTHYCTSSRATCNNYKYMYMYMCIPDPLLLLSTLPLVPQRLSPGQCPWMSQ